MTKKDFELIARALLISEPPRNEAHNEQRLGWIRTVMVMRDALATTNPRFDMARFMVAATGSDIVI